MEKSFKPKLFKKILITLPNPEPFLILKRNVLWSCTRITNKCNEYIFQFQNNLLGINAMIHNFNNFISEGCTFCEIRKNFPVQRETFVHLFFECPETENTLTGFENLPLQDLHLENISDKKTFWFWEHVNLAQGKNSKKILQLMLLMIMFYLWECKLKKCAQSVTSTKNFYYFNMDPLIKISYCCYATY
jgi:hypothetical protein